MWGRIIDWYGGVPYKPKGGEPGFEDMVEIKLKELPPNLQKKFMD